MKSYCVPTVSDRDRPRVGEISPSFYQNFTKLTNRLSDASVVIQSLEGLEFEFLMLPL